MATHSRTPGAVPPNLRRYGVDGRGRDVQEWLRDTHGGSYASKEPFGVAIALANYWNRRYPGSDHNRQGVTTIIANLESAGYLVVDRNPQNTPVRISLPPSATNGDTPKPRPSIGERIERANVSAYAPPPPPGHGQTPAELDARLNTAYDRINDLEQELSAAKRALTDAGQHIIKTNGRIHKLIEWAKIVSIELGANPPECDA